MKPIAVLSKAQTLGKVSLPSRGVLVLQSSGTHGDYCLEKSASCRNAVCKLSCVHRSRRRGVKLPRGPLSLDVDTACMQRLMRAAHLRPWSLMPPATPLHGNASKSPVLWVLQSATAKRLVLFRPQPRVNLWCLVLCGSDVDAASAWSSPDVIQRFTTNCAIARQVFLCAIASASIVGERPHGALSEHLYSLTDTGLECPYVRGRQEARNARVAHSVKRHADSAHARPSRKHPRQSCKSCKQSFGRVCFGCNLRG